MPTYVYEAAEGEKGCPACNVGIEIEHGINDPAPTECPRCGSRLSKRFTPPGLITRWNEKSTLSDANLKRHGFKKIRNEGNGRFRVT